MNGFLPISKQDMTDRGWYYCDFLIVTGDAYVDHPSFGTAIISRVLEDAGYKVAILSQPDFRDEHDFLEMGRPRYAVLINGGNIDSMVAHYTAAKKHRNQDLYSPGGKMGLRPDYAVIVYSNLIRRTFKKTPIIIGGIEASLRRLAHYDYWSDKMKRSVLLDSGADIISYGMGERSIVEIAEALRSAGHDGDFASQTTGRRGTVMYVPLCMQLSLFQSHVSHLNPLFHAFSVAFHFPADDKVDQLLRHGPRAAEGLGIGRHLHGVLDQRHAVVGHAVSGLLPGRQPHHQLQLRRGTG